MRRSWLPAWVGIVFGALVLGGLALQIGPLWHLWWGNWNLLSRWIWFASMWGAVASAFFGAWAAGSPRRRGLSPFIESAARQPASVHLRVLAPFLSTLAAGHLSAGLIIWGWQSRWGFGFVEPWSLAAGLAWMGATTLLGYVTGTWTPPIVAWIAAPAVVFWMTVIAIQSGPDYAIYWLLPFSKPDSASQVEATGLWSLRLVVLALLCALGMLVVARSKWLALSALAALSFTFPLLSDFRFDPWTPLTAAESRECVSRDELTICVTRSQQVSLKQYADQITRMIARAPELAAGVTLVSADPEFRPSSAEQLQVGLGVGHDVDAQGGDNASIAMAFAERILARGCEDKANLELSSMLELRLATFYGGAAVENNEVWALARESLARRTQIEPALAKAADKALSLPEGDLRRLVLERRSSATACAMTPAEFAAR